jgi:menaquinone-specific isochorismate synthase
MMDVALFRLPDGQAWMGLGPFTETNVQPTESAFYINDFDLSDPQPWKIPAELRQVQPSDLPQDATLRLRWDKPVTEWFKMAFRRIRREVLAHKLEKMVPVLTKKGEILEGTIAILLRRIADSPNGGWGYARLAGDVGYAGITPELLFEKNGASLKTMALAGTAKPGDDETFLRDSKEIEEHEIVVRFIAERLSTVGEVTRGQRGIYETSGLRHFHTPITAQLAGEVSADDLVQLLHPTPAVGCLPRTPEWLAKLREYRNQLKVPSFFGAPFGFAHDGVVRMTVAIRGVSWDKQVLSLPSGCGVVGGSAFDHEWRELRLKRESVVRMLGL